MNRESARAAVLVPAYQEASSLVRVLDAVRDHHAGLLLVVDDGSRDETPALLSQRRDIQLLTHAENLGYGRSLIDGFAFARSLNVERLVTIDCDGQHEAAHIPTLLRALDDGADIVSGSRYLPGSRVVGRAPADRRSINAQLTAEVNRVTGWQLTDAFCGLKAYRLAALCSLGLSEPGYAIALELWAKAHLAKLTVQELAVDRIYFDRPRSFGGELDSAERRLAYYLKVWHRALSLEEP